MTSDTLLAALVVVTIVVTWLLVRARPGDVRRYFFAPIENGRTVIGGLILLAGVITALQSGVAWMVMLALIGVAFAVTFVYYEEPHKDIR